MTGRELPFRRPGPAAPAPAPDPVAAEAVLEEITELAQQELGRLDPHAAELRIRFVGGPLAGKDHPATFPPIAVEGGVYRWKGKLKLVWERDE